MRRHTQKTDDPRRRANGIGDRIRSTEIARSRYGALAGASRGAFATTGVARSARRHAVTGEVKADV